MNTVRFNRLASQGILLWLDGVNIATITVGIGIAAIANQRWGLVGLLTSGVLWIPLVIIGLQKRYGLALPIIYGREIVFMFRRATGATRQVVRPDASPARPVGRLNLPGRTGYVKLWETAEGIAVVYDPTASTATIVCELSGDDFTGASTHRQNMLVEEWAKVKGAWTLRPGIVRVCTLERTSPGTTQAARAYFDHNTQDVPATLTEHQAIGLTAIRASGLQSVQRAEELISRHRTQVAITFSKDAMRKDIAAHGGGKDGFMACLDLEIETIGAALTGAGFVDVAFQTVRRWAGTGRAMLDPEYAAQVENRMGTALDGVDPVGIGPMAIDEHRSYVVTDSGYHRTMWVHEWPRLETYPGFIDKIVFAKTADRAPIRHTLNIIETPVALKAALARISKEKKTWLQNDRLRAKHQKMTSAADTAEWDALVRQEEELVQGRGEYRYSGLVTITALRLDELERASSAMRNAFANAGLEPQILYTQQAEALMVNAFPTGKGMK